MGVKTGIEWTESTWTPVRALLLSPTAKVGWHCEHVSPGCANCYSEGINKRLGTGLPFKPGHRKNVSIFLDETMLLAPLRWKKPRMIFVCSMTDLFADFVTDEMIDRVFAVMALCPQHTFQVLTKRSTRMREYLTKPVQGALAGRMHRIVDGKKEDATDVWGRVHDALCGVLPSAPVHQLNLASEMQEKHGDGFMPRWPLPNVWLGVSAEDQTRADERIPDLLATPAVVRWVSAEPLIGRLSFRWLRGFNYRAAQKDRREIHEYDGLRLLDWIVVGGESGPNARPMHPQWARDIRDQCADAGVPFFFKQWGEFVSVSEVAGPGEHFKFPDGATVRRTGKRLAGRTLDHVTHDAMPVRP